MESRRAGGRALVTASAAAAVRSELLPTAAQVVAAAGTDVKIGEHAFTELADIPPFLLVEYDLDRNSRGANDKAAVLERGRESDQDLDELAVCDSTQ